MQALTFATEGSTHRRFTVDDILRLQDAGIISEDDDFELIEGEIIPMGPKYFPHDNIKMKLGRSLDRACPDDLFCAQEPSVQLSANSFVDPDLCLCRLPEQQIAKLLPVQLLLLAIEVAATSLRYDLGRKARAYARAGVPELWVIDVQTRRTHIHTGLSESGWASIVVREAVVELTFAGLPAWKVRLKDL